MPGRSGLLPWLLLLPPPAWAALIVSVPSSPIRAPPGSDVRLPCNISDSSGPLSLSHLAVMWKIGEKIVAQYEDNFKPFRQGAVMSKEQLLKGDASLLLQDVQDSDASLYSCFVIHMPNRGEGSVELKVEAPPHLTLSSTKVQLAEVSAVTCTMSGFYPSSISVEWLRNDVVDKGPESPLSQRTDDGLFNAYSILQLKPLLADVGANFSCRVHHQALDGLLQKDFQLQVQARPVIQDLIVLEERNLSAARCLVSGFYPPKIKVQWLRNGNPQETMQSEPRQMPNGTFTIKSSIIQPETDPTASYVCQVFHESLADPLKLTAHWHPKGSSPSPERSKLCVHPYVIGLAIALIVSVIVLAAGILCYKTRGKQKKSSGSEKENLNDSTTPL
ncbi:programmed cell death 1 ligand 2-like isoform X2 [Tiliqua scincoides]|uniref:programmed cell death 1 ligand 2-like isoform X2 n=1 Tax=Tiliqua scincoides TaxID=71010 RepID=UPI003461F36F